MSQPFTLQGPQSPQVLVCAVSGVLSLGLGLFSGCAKNPYLLQAEINNLKTNNELLAAENKAFQERSAQLNRDNASLVARMARIQQQSDRDSELLKDQVNALQQQLTIAARQIAKLRQSESGGNRLATRPPDRAPSTSSGNQQDPEGDLPGERPYARITANSSLRNNLPKFDFQGVHVRTDRDLVRVELPADRLFAPGEAKLLPEAYSLVREVTAELERRYPDQKIAVEGHTDRQPLPRGSAYLSNHELSVERAQAVHTFILGGDSRLRPQQLFLEAHGPYRPVVSNATEEGRQRNRRVELVIYPERVGQ